MTHRIGRRTHLPLRSIADAAGSMKDGRKGKRKGTDRLIFQFVLRFDPNIVSSRMAGDTQQKMSEWFRAKRLDFQFGMQGGISTLYGYVYRHRANATLEDRTDLAQWLQQQRIKCEVGLGDLERPSKADFCREITEFPFEIDNFSDSMLRDER